VKFQKELKIGITVIVAVAFLLWGVFFLKGVNVFGSNRTFYATYKNVSGLVPASPVFVKGVKVGQVAGISFDAKKDVVVVEMTIEYSSLKIPNDSKALFSSADFFTKSVDIVIGKSNKYYKEGDTILSEKPLSLQENVNAELLPLKKKTEQLIGTIDSMVAIISGVLGRNSEGLDQSFQSVRRAILTFENTAENLDGLIASERLRISSILNKVDNISGSVSSNLPQITKMIDNFKVMSDSLKNADLAGAVNKAQSTLNQISQITTKINNGEGTLGALIKSDSLFNALVKTNDEVQRLVENMKMNPHRYVHFSVFGKREKGLKLDSRDEKRLKELLNEPKK
jgi:phospholipid/cholesterol/gamma-HCH transport system substrate-binding protein